MHPRQREGLKSLVEDDVEFNCINSMTLGETQSGVNRHLKTKVLGTSSRKTDHR